MPVCQFEPDQDPGRNIPMAQIRQKRQVFGRDPVKKLGISGVSVWQN